MYKQNFLVIGCWFDKETKKPKANLVPINEGTSKTTQLPYSIGDPDKMIYSAELDEYRPAGSIIGSVLSFTGKPSNPPASPAPLPPPKSTKA